MKTRAMHMPENFNSPIAQGFSAIICWILAYRIPGELLSIPVVDTVDMVFTLGLKILGAVATCTTIASFYFKNEVRVKKIFKIFKRK